MWVTRSSTNRIIEEFDLKEVYVFSTAAMRNVENSFEVLEEMKEKIGLDIQLLSGKKEGFCDFLGIQMEKEIEDGYIVDIGGESSEIVIVSQGKYLDS